MKLRILLALASSLLLLIGISPVAQAAPTVVASSAGTKTVGHITNVWGRVSEPGVREVWTEVVVGGNWSRSQVSRTKSDGSYVIELTYGILSKGDFRYRVGARTSSGTVYSAPFTLRRTGWEPSHVASKPVGEVTNVWTTMPLAANRSVWTEVIVGGRWSRSQTRTANSSGYVAIPLTYGANQPGSFTYRVVASTSRGTAYSEPFVLRRVAAPVPPGTDQQMLDAVNAARRAGATCGSTRMPAVPAVTWNSRLAQAAATHSNDMARRNFFSHTGSDGSSHADRVSRAGYSWRTVGENIAGGQRTVNDVMAGWMASPGHCLNIMNGSYTEFGHSLVTDNNSRYGTYWTQIFAAPR